MDKNLGKDGNLSIIQKLDIINSNRVNKKIYESLKSKFDNLKIEILASNKGNLFDLMEKGLLEGWCWQTTETAILFLEDNYYIKRGNLITENNRKYYHSWIEYDNYVFDPCLNIFVNKKIYDYIFTPEVIATISSKQVKDYFIKYIKENKTKKQEKSYLDNFLSRVCSESYERQKNEVLILSNDDVYSPMYRNNVGYKAQIEDDKILSLTAHYYLNG